MFLVTSVTTLRERTSGTLERLLAMPMGKLDFLLGYAVAFGLVAAVQSALAVGVCVWLLDLTIAGAVWMLMVVAIVDAVLGTALGLFVSAFARTEFQAVQFMPALVIPQILLCGLFVPRDSLPRVLELISDVLPLSYAVDAMQTVAVVDRDRRRLAGHRHRRGLRRRRPRPGCAHASAPDGLIRPARVSGVRPACAPDMRMSLMGLVSAPLAAPGTFACPYADPTLARRTTGWPGGRRPAHLSRGRAELLRWSNGMRMSLVGLVSAPLAAPGTFACPYAAPTQPTHELQADQQAAVP